MKAIFTGTGGTGAPVVASYYSTCGYIVEGYDRDLVPVDDEKKIETFLDEAAPDVFLHFATGPVDWTRMLAELCKKKDIRFIFISSVSVFGKHQKGPFKKEDKPEPDSDYGKYKLESEQKAHAANDKTTTIRLGWQIGVEPSSGNEMLAQLKKEMDDNGVVKASTNFYPSVSFMEETAKAVYEIMDMDPDIYLVNSNKNHSYYDIVNLLKDSHPFIEVTPTDEPDLDNRMIDERVPVAYFKSKSLKR